jgi:hypothetical protein
MNPSIAHKSKIKFGIGGEEDMTFETACGIFHNRIPWLTKESRECAK